MSLRVGATSWLQYFLISIRVHLWYFQKKYQPKAGKKKTALHPEGLILG
jgi:hypothetical protein